MDEIFNHVSPIVIMFMSLFVVIGIIIFYKITRLWSLMNLILIPIAFFFLYFWVNFFRPEIYLSRLYLRCVMISSLSITLHVLWVEISKTLRGRRVGD